MIAFENVTFSYPGTEKRVFHDLSFSLPEPGFHAFFGPSGVGKTSAARIISGELNGYTGSVRLDNLPVSLYSYNLERLPGWSGVGRHLEKVSSPAFKDRLNDLVEVFGVGGCLNARFSNLSLGQRNRINLIRYLLQDFHLLIMDESLANVDELTRERILLKIKDMFPRAFFLYISHNVVEVSRFCDRIVVFRGAHKTPQTLMVQGQNLRTGVSMDRSAFERTMLEIMNAS